MSRFFALVVAVGILITPAWVRAALTVSNAAASSITNTSAVISGYLSGTNGTNPVLALYYGKVDGGTNAGAWGYSNRPSSAAVPVGTYIVTNTGLEAGTRYVYRWQANDGTSTAWASVASNFWTLSTPPTNPPAPTNSPVMVNPAGIVISPTDLFKVNGVATTSTAVQVAADLAAHTNAAPLTAHPALGTVALLPVAGVVTSVVYTTGAVSNSVTQTGSVVYVNFANAALYRYAARTNSGEEINVLATGLGVTASRTSTTITMTIPAGVRVLSLTVRWDGSLGSGYTLDMGTADMGNTALTDRWGALFSACREDTGALIAGASCRLDTSDHDTLIVGGLPTTTTTHCRLGF